MPKLGKKRYGYDQQGMQDYIKALRRKRALKRKKKKPGYYPGGGYENTGGSPGDHSG